MKVVAHISDLHFGTEDPLVAAGLLEDLQRIAPALVIISGDLTQRARCAQFRAARDYLECISFPRLTIPGNHDVPLYDVVRRFLAPLKRYCRFIDSSLDPWYHDDKLAVLGLNTARSLTWKSGRLSMKQIELIRTRFRAAPDACFKILVTHHPFIPPPGDENTGIDLVGRAALALPVIDECEIDLLLAGHLHHGYTGDVRAYYPATKRSIVVAQAGTAISHRVRREPNAYNVISLEDDTIEIAVRSWSNGAFRESTRIAYRLAAEEWRLTNTYGVTQR
ncbi:MAG TPA: metallophosphoesterase family protein [Verrucomicrobiae bacterium]|nr:metallophosphoesterase family protein [Verrucomicrobiae bacterium]